MPASTLANVDPTVGTMIVIDDDCVGPMLGDSNTGIGMGIIIKRKFRSNGDIPVVSVEVGMVNIATYFVRRTSAPQVEAPQFKESQSVLCKLL